MAFKAIWNDSKSLTDIDCPPYWVELDTGEIIDGITKPNIDTLLADIECL